MADPIKDKLKHVKTQTVDVLRKASNRVRDYLRVVDKYSDPDGGILPNFCNDWVVFNVIVIAEMLAIVIALVSSRSFNNPILILLYTSILVQSIALVSAGALCLTRKYLNRLPKARAMIMAYLLLLCITWLVSELTYWLLIFVKAEAFHIDRDSFLIQNLFVSAIVMALTLRYFVAKHELKLRSTSEAKAKMQALQSRMRPHFLFNSMNIIAGLTYSSPEKAEAALIDISDLFRMMLNDKENLVPVNNEIAIAEKYLALEKLRLDNRITIKWDIGKFPRKAIMPVLTLQPLLENAINYGIETQPHGGTINIKLWEEADKIHIHITSPVPPKKNQAYSESYNEAFDVIRMRFQNHYGEDAYVDSQFTDTENNITVVLPVRGGKP